jgi:hypothetical protein
MKFCESIIRKRLEFTEKLHGYAKHGTRRKNELSRMCRDYKEAHDFLTGKIESVSFVPDYSVREIKRQLNWLEYAKELHAETIEEVNYVVNKMKEDGTKGLSNQHSEQGG